MSRTALVLGAGLGGITVIPLKMGRPLPNIGCSPGFDSGDREDLALIAAPNQALL